MGNCNISSCAGYFWNCDGCYSNKKGYIIERTWAKLIYYVRKLLILDRTWCSRYRGQLSLSSYSWFRKPSLGKLSGLEQSDPCQRASLKTQP